MCVCVCVCVCVCAATPDWLSVSTLCCLRELCSYSVLCCCCFFASLCLLDLVLFSVVVFYLTSRCKTTECDWMRECIMCLCQPCLKVMISACLTSACFFQLQQVLVKHSPNTVIFGMLDREFIFINKEQTRVKNLIKKVSFESKHTVILVWAF